MSCGGGSVSMGAGQNRERLDTIERGDSFAPATARALCTGPVYIPPYGGVFLPISSVSEVTGNIFEYLPGSQSLLIKQGGVFAHMVVFSAQAAGSANIVIALYQSPFNYFLLSSLPFQSQPDFIVPFLGGTQIFNVPSGGSDYQVSVALSGGTGSITLNYVDLRFVYLGRR